MSAGWPQSLSITQSSDAAQLATSLADVVQTDLQGAVDSRGRASLLVSGGSTPLAFFQSLASRQLSHTGQSEHAAWSQVTVGLVDERWLPTNHKDSNENLVRSNLLVEKAAEAKLTGLYSDAADAAAGLPEANSAIAGILEQHEQAFDVLILGMGGDAHTASLFPVVPEQTSDRDIETLTAALQSTSAKDDDHCVNMAPATAPYQRISLTVASILKARNLYLHIVGEQKKQVLLSALDNPDPMFAPISAIFRYRQPRIFWSP